MLLFVFLALASSVVAQSKKAVDVNVPVSQAQFKCVSQAGYSAAFIRAYKPDGEGSFDQNCVTNINNAYQAGVSTEIFMTPRPNSTKWGFEQADELHKDLKKNGVQVRRVWLQVTDPSTYSSNQINNCGFINDVMMRNRANGYSVGVYTSKNDWNTITGNWQWAGSDVSLWYYNWSGAGTSGESQPNFNDFTQFGAWQTPTVKQYGKSETICGLNMNV